MYAARERERAKDTFLRISFQLDGYSRSINTWILFQVRATDPDCGVNAMVNYTLAAGRMESEQLMVRSDTGDICVRTPLDRETAPYLEIPVIATDRGTYYIHTHICIYNSRDHPQYDILFVTLRWNELPRILRAKARKLTPPDTPDRLASRFVS